MRKLSVAIDEHVADAAAAAAAAAGLSLSAWLTKAAAHQAGIEAGLQGVREYEAECGPISEERLREAAEELVALGVLDRDVLNRDVPYRDLLDRR